MMARAHVRLRWFLSFLGVIALPFVIAIFIFVRGEQLIRQETDRVHQAQLSVLIRGLDTTLKEIRSVEISMIQDPELEALVVGAYPKNEEYLAARRLIQRYGSKGLNPESSVNWMVFIGDTNKVLTTTTYTQDRNYLDQELYGQPSWALSRWRLQMRALENQQFHLGSSAGWSAESGDSVLLYARHIPSGRVEQAEAVLAFEVSTPLVRALLENMLNRADDAVIIRSRGRSIVVGNEHGDSGFVLLDPRIFPADSKTMEIGGTLYTLYRDRSQEMPIEVIYALADQGAFGALRAHRSASVVALLVCLMLAVALSGYLVMRQYGPVRRLLELVIQSKGSPVRIESDEFRIIESTLARAMEETDELRSVVLGHERSLDLYRFRSLLRDGAADPGASAGSFFHLIGVDEFVVILIDPVVPGRRSEIDTAARAHFQTGITVCDLVSMGGGMCAVVGAAEPMDRHKLSTSAEGLLRELRSSVDADLALALSSTHNAGDSPRIAVDEARRALEYRIVEGTERILEPHVATMQRETFEFTLQQENELINRILVGDFLGARAVTDEIMKRNFGERALTIEMGRCLAFSLATMFVRTLNRVARFRENRLWDDLRPIERISRCVTYDALLATIVELLQLVCEEIGTNRQSHSEILVGKIDAYIQERLHHPNLGTREIADQFDMNPAYLARVFKEYSGLSFSDYINRTRIEISKELLSATDRTVADIGQQIGYLESSSFIRFFKKFEGITPGVFREECDRIERGVRIDE